MHLRLKLLLPLDHVINQGEDSLGSSMFWGLEKPCKSCGELTKFTKTCVGRQEMVQDMVHQEQGQRVVTMNCWQAGLK
jgi:hypothetical protein